jgi:hypothetical protein
VNGTGWNHLGLICRDIDECWVFLWPLSGLDESIGDLARGENPPGYIGVSYYLYGL